MEIKNIGLNNSLGKSEIGIQISDSKSGDNFVDNRMKKNIDKKELNSALEKANKILFKNNTHLKFQIHEKTKDVMVKIINDETGETLKEFPPEKILDMVAKLWEIAGIFVDEKR